MVRCFSNRSKLNNHEIETVVLNTINPMNSKKWVTTFSWIFHFSLADFSKKIYETFFTNALFLRVCGTFYKVKKKENLFFPARVRLL